MSDQSRRSLLKNLALGATAMMAAPHISIASEYGSKKKLKLKGNINHSVCRWTYSFLTVDELCSTVKKIGFNAIDLFVPKAWLTLKTIGLNSSMCIGAEISLTQEWNDKQYHTTLIKIILSILIW